MRAAFCVIAALATAVLPVAPAMAQSDPQAAHVEQLALDYLKTGASDPTNSQAVGEAGVDFAVGIISLGVVALGVPGAGAVIAVLGGLFSAATASVPSVVDQRLNALEANVRSLRTNIAGLSIDIANNDNLDRVSNLERIADLIGRDANELSEVPQMPMARKVNLVKNALDNANNFLPTLSADAASLWEWTNVRVKGDPATRSVSATKEKVDNINLALPLYLQSIAVLAAAIDATGIHPKREELRPHLYFLGGPTAGTRPTDPNSVGEIEGLTSLLDRADDITCRSITPAKPEGSTGNEGCAMPVRCTSPVTAVSGTIHFAASYGITFDCTA